MQAYTLDGDDLHVLSLCESTARQLLTRPDISADQIVTLGRLINFINHLPQVTQITRFHLSLEFRVSSKEFSEMTCISFDLSDIVLEASKGGSVNYGQGSDSLTYPKWYKSINHKHFADDEFFDIDDFANEVSSILSNEYHFTLSEESE